MGTSADIAKASSIIIGLTVADKLLAIIKEMIVSHRFGISPDLDVFNIAYAFTGILLLIFTDTIVHALIPLYQEWRTALTPSRADARVCALLWAATLFFMLLASALYLLSPLVFSLIGYGFDPDRQQQGARLQQFLSVLLVIDGGGAILAALLQAKKKFIHLQTAPLFINIASIIILLVFSTQLDIDALVWGLIAGTLCKSLYMAETLRRAGFSFSLRPRFELTEFLLLALPLLGSAIFANLNMLVDQIMSTSLSAGSVSSLRYAFRVYDMPVQIVIVAFSKALFPYISQQAALMDYDGLRKYFKQSLIFVCLLSFPATACTIVLSHDIIGILFQRGAFDASAVAQTAEILIFYSLGLIFNAYCFVNGAFFAALKNNAPLLYMGILSVVLNIALNFVFMRLLDVQGIALATTVTAGGISFLFIYLLKRRLGITDFSRVGANIRTIGIACLIMLGIGLITRNICAALALGRMACFCATGTVMLTVYFSGLWLLKTPEILGYLDLTRGLFRQCRDR